MDRRPSQMDEQLLEAAIAGDAEKMRLLAQENPALLLGTTAQGNTCLHISSIHGHEVFCTEFLDQSPSLLSVTNKDGETPLVTAVVNGHASLASVLLKYYHRDDGQLNRQAVLLQNRHGCNVLHHAIRSGYQDLALELIAAAPALSHARNRFKESPMFIAVVRGYTNVFDKLLEIEGSKDSGVNGYNALHAAVKYDNKDIAEKIMERRPWLATKEDNKKDTPLHLAAHYNRVSILTMMLNRDRSLGYTISSDGALNWRRGEPLLVTAATRGHVKFAAELLKHCPDAPYCDATGKTCLFEAIENNRINFIDFVVREPKLQKLINMQNAHGDSALHLAVKKCNPKMVTALLRHPNIDATAINKYGCSAVWKLYEFDNYAKTINWNEISNLILDKDPRAKADIYNLHEEVKNKVIDASRKNVKSLTETYTSNTSLVAILIATITFTAAFTLPGGYSDKDGSEGLPILAKNLAFQAFIIADTLAMCSSFAVAFICVVVRWMDFEFLLYYRSITKKLMWFAYMATALAFATGLYTVLAPRVYWLAAAVCILSVLLPIATMLFGEWPTLKLRLRRKEFNSGLFDIV